MKTKVIIPAIAALSVTGILAGGHMADVDSDSNGELDVTELKALKEAMRAKRGKARDDTEV